MAGKFSPHFPDHSNASSHFESDFDAEVIRFVPTSILSRAFTAGTRRMNEIGT